MNTKRYSELKKLKTFEERFEYLKLNGTVGEDTFGYDRYLNQAFYKSRVWREDIRPHIIARDMGCDLGIEGREINGPIYIHHINPINIEDLIAASDMLTIEENLICCSFNTHNAIHYGDADLLITEPITRSKNDTCPWKR